MLHYKYWIGILVALLVLVTSTAWSANNQLVAIVGFAATLSSMVLAVLAIILSTQSSDSLYRGITLIVSSSTKMETAAVNLEQLSKALEEKVDNIPTALSAMSDQIERAQESWGNHTRELIDKTNTITAENQTPSAGAAAHKIDLKQLIDRSPPGGVLAMYACLLSHKEGRPFDPSEYMEERAASFARGFIYCLKSTGVISTKYKNSTFTITSIGILDYEFISSLIEELSPKNSFIAKYKPRIDTYFLHSDS